MGIMLSYHRRLGRFDDEEAGIIQIDSIYIVSMFLLFTYITKHASSLQFKLIMRTCTYIAYHELLLNILFT